MFHLSLRNQLIINILKYTHKKTIIHRRYLCQKRCKPNAIKFAQNCRDAPILYHNHCRK